MLDTFNNKLAPRSRIRGLKLWHWLQNLWFHGANFFLAGSKNRWSFVREKWDIALTRGGIRLRTMYHDLVRSSGRQNSYPHMHVREVNDQAAMKYMPRPYSGRVVVIRPKGNFRRFDHPSLGWSDVVRDGLEIRELPFYPKGMLVEPFVQTLAQELRECLSEAK